jgi:hypothetical protein
MSSFAAGALLGLGSLVLNKFAISRAQSRRSRRHPRWARRELLGGHAGTCTALPDLALPGTPMFFLRIALCVLLVVACCLVLDLGPCLVVVVVRGA